MLKKIMLGIMCCCALTAAPCRAGDVMFGPYLPDERLGLDMLPQGFYGPYQTSFNDFKQTDQPPLYRRDGMRFQLAGEKKEGALSLFLAADSFSVEENNPFENDLNALSPAAGIQFTIDFNL